MRPHLLKPNLPCPGCGGGVAELGHGLLGAASCRYCQGVVDVSLGERLVAARRSIDRLAPWLGGVTRFRRSTAPVDDDALTVRDQLRRAMSDTRLLYEQSARHVLETVSDGVAGDQHAFIDAAQQLGKGMLVKLFVAAVGDDAMSEQVERALVDLLVEQLGGTPADPRAVRGQLAAIEPDLDLRMLLRPFEQLPSFRRQVTPLFSHASRVVNLITKFDRVVTPAELERTTLLHEQLRRHIARFPRLAPVTHRASLDPQLLDQLRADGRWVRRQLGSLDATTTERRLHHVASLDSLLAELDALIGIRAVKQDVRGLAQVLSVRRERARRGLPEADLRFHVAFLGNPGTGQGTVAALLGRLCAAMGELSRGHLTETSGEALAEGTASLDERLAAAEGGVLLVHGASALARGTSDDARNAWTRLLRQAPAARGRLLLILSDTRSRMSEVLEANDTLAHCCRTLEFEDYSAVELCRVLESMAKAGRYRLSRRARLELSSAFHYIVEREGRLESNAGALSQMFDEAVLRQARRVAEATDSGPGDLAVMEAADFALEGVPESVRSVLPSALVTECPRCGKQGRFPSSLLGDRIQCRSCEHELVADWGVPD